MKIAVDIGGVMSRYPDIFRPLIDLLNFRGSDPRYGIEVFILSDMKPHTKAVAYCHDNGFMIPEDHILTADYAEHGESCKAIICHEKGIDILIDDHPGYVCTPGCPPVRLLVMPSPEDCYYHSSWKTDGSEGDFGRRKGSKPPWKGKVN